MFYSVKDMDFYVKENTRIMINIAKCSMTSSKSMVDHAHTLSVRNRNGYHAAKEGMCESSHMALYR